MIIERCLTRPQVYILLALPLFFVFAEIDDAPGVVGVGLVVPFASIVIAIFTAVLQKLLYKVLVV